MKRRELLAMTGVGAAGLLVSSSTRAAVADDAHDHEIDHEHIKTVGECVILCNMAAHHCLDQLKKDDVKNRDLYAQAHAMTMGCQTFCVQVVTLVTQHSPLAKYAHRACADACRDCAAVCDKLDAEIMKKCAEACRACEKVCRSHHAEKKA